MLFRSRVTGDADLALLHVAGERTALRGVRRAHRGDRLVEDLEPGLRGRGRAAELRGKAALEEGRAFAPKFDADGLIVCITTEMKTGDILMVAYMNAESLRLTLETGVAHYWSRSRRALWRKGETSGQTQFLKDLRVDCDGDTLLVLVDQAGVACHTGRPSCFFNQLRDGQWVEVDPVKKDPKEIYAK